MTLLADLSEAEAIAARLADEPFDVLVSSDLGRAMQTAQFIARRCGLPVIADERLRERSFGAGEGMTYAEIDRAWPLVEDVLAGRYKAGQAIPGWDGRAAERVAEALAERYGGSLGT